MRTTRLGAITLKSLWSNQEEHGGNRKSAVEIFVRSGCRVRGPERIGARIKRLRGRWGRERRWRRLEELRRWSLQGSSTTESLVPCIIDPDSFAALSSDLFAAVFRSVSFFLETPPVGLLPPPEIVLPACLPTYLPTDSRSNHLPTTSSRVWQKKPWMLGPARGRDRSIDCKLTREMVGGDPATIPDSVLWLARASFCTSFGKSHSN